MLALFSRAAPVLALAFALILTASLVVGCDGPTPPPLITATELAPAEVEIGDRLEVLGTGFPKGKIARMTFRGTLHRPGETPGAAEIEVQAAATSAQRIELAVNEPLQVSFCGHGDHARHTTFRGEIEVAFPAVATGAPPVAATLANVTLDLRPASPGRGVLDRDRAEAERALAFMGLALDAAPSATGGIAVRSVAPGSRADAAGLVAGDVVTTFDGVRVLGIDDMVPSGARARVALGVRRAGARDELVDVAVDGYRLAAPRDLIAGGLLLLVATGIVVLFFAPGAGLLGWLERRLATRLRGESLRALATRATSARAPLFAAGAASLLFAIMPFGRYVVLADLDIGLLFLVGLTSLATIGWLTGGLRAAAQITSFAVPAALAIACVVLMTGSTRLHEIVRAQGGAPWSFYAFRSPVALALFGLHFASALAQSSLVPAELAEADAEPRPNARGPLARHVSAMAEWINVVLTSGTSAALFLGGWRVPGVTLGQQSDQLALELLGSALFLAKVALLVLLAVALRRALPVVKVRQTMRLCWRWLVPLAVAGLALTVGWVAWSPSPLVERILAIGTCSVVLLAFVRLVHRIRYAARFAPTDSPASAFL